jgi:hypothetical protein
MWMMPIGKVSELSTIVNYKKITMALRNLAGSVTMVMCITDGCISDNAFLEQE